MALNTTASFATGTILLLQFKALEARLSAPPPSQVLVAASAGVEKTKSAAARKLKQVTVWNTVLL